MIDLHAHLLPDWDDGAADKAESDRMIEIAREDGISGIALTPHVFSMSKTRNEAKDLKIRIRAFRDQTKPSGVDFYPGAEVYVHTEMISHIREHELTVNGSDYVFIEFPSQSLSGGASNLIYRMMLAGLIPIISHPERNAEFARRPQALYEAVRNGALAQVTAQSLLGGFGKHTQNTSELFLRHGLVHLIASDAHNALARPPRLSAAVEKAAEIAGAAKASAMVTAVPVAILENQQIPDLGEPKEPGKDHWPRYLFR